MIIKSYFAVLHPKFGLKGLEYWVFCEGGERGSSDLDMVMVFEEGQDTFENTWI